MKDVETTETQGEHEVLRLHNARQGEHWSQETARVERHVAEQGSNRRHKDRACGLSFVWARG